MAEAVCGLLQTGRFVLLGLRSPDEDACPRPWDLIGGHVEGGETLDAALARELREEIGVTPLVIRGLGTILGANDAAGRLHVFLVSNWLGDPRIVAPEHTELRWFAVEQACRLPNLALAAYVPFLASL